MILCFNHHFPLEKSPVAGSHCSVTVWRAARPQSRMQSGSGCGGGADPGGMGALEVTEKRLLLTSGQSWVGISDDPLHSTFPPQALLNFSHYLFIYFLNHTHKTKPQVPYKGGLAARTLPLCL